MSLEKQFAQRVPAVKARWEWTKKQMILIGSLVLTPVRPKLFMTKVK